VLHLYHFQLDELLRRKVHRLAVSIVGFGSAGFRGASLIFSGFLTKTISCPASGEYIRQPVANAANKRTANVFRILQFSIDSRDVHG
jgi:hypothetical protein